MRPISSLLLILLALCFIGVGTCEATVSIPNLTTTDCRGCHGANLATRHHLLIGLTGKLCLDCHQLTWDQQMHTFVFAGTHECITCHVTSLADKHHILVQHSDLECFSCHAVEFDETIKSYYVTFNYAGAREQVSHYFNHIMAANDCTGCHTTNLVDEHDRNCYYCHATNDPYVRLAVTVGYRDCTACHNPSFKHLTRCGICHAPLLPVTSDISSLHRRHMHRVNCGYCHQIKDHYTLTKDGEHCAICHTTARPYVLGEIPDLHKIHVKGRGIFPYSCYMCHGRNAPQMHPDQCSVCHVDDRLYQPQALQTIHRTHNQYFDCTNCHFDPMDLMLYTKLDSCTRCHEARSYTNSLSVHGLSHKDKSCWVCHPADELMSEQGSYPTGCRACHPTTPVYPNAQWVHYRHINYQCWVCHPAIYPIIPSMRQPFNAASGSVEGLVTATDGSPIKGARIFTQNSGFLSLSRLNGGYALRYLPPGYYRIIVEAAGHVSQNNLLKIMNGQSTMLNFSLTPVPPEMSSITGRITDEAQGALGGAMVTVGGNIGTAVTAPDGAYVISALPPGSYSLEISKTGFVASSVTVTTTVGQGSTANATLTVLPHSALCVACHEDRSSKVSCSNKNWRRHLKQSRVSWASFEEAETLYLGQTCRVSGYWVGAASISEEETGAGGDLSGCTTCHASHSDKVACGNTAWRVHTRKNRIDKATSDLAESTYLGERCP